MPSATRPIVFASDFGLGNEWVGICHSVLAGLSPQSPIVDLTHLIRPLEVLSGALLLADSMPYVAEDAVVLGVVDPNVGKDREVAIGTSSGRYLVGPDNGLLSLAWEAAGGITEAVEISACRIGGATLDPAIELHQTRAQFGQMRAAAGKAASFGCHDRAIEGLLYLLDQQPCFAIAHVHGCRGAPDGAQFGDAFQQLRHARPQSAAGRLEVDANGKVRHGASPQIMMTIAMGTAVPSPPSPTSGAMRAPNAY